jgi:pilus assembly protein CpaC
MHRKLCRPGALLRAALLALLIWAPGICKAQTTGTAGAALIVPINGTLKLQMSTKQLIKKVEAAKDGVISIRTVVGDPTAILITGLQPDLTDLILTDTDGKQERYQAIVQLDVEYLRTQLRRAVPTANITPIPVSNNSVIMAGTVDKVEDVEVVLRVAQSLKVEVINAMRVGGVQQVQLDVVVASVTRSEARQFGFDFLLDSKNFFLGSTVAQAVAQPASVGNTGVFSVAPTLVGNPGANSNVLFGVVHNGWGFLGFLNALRTEGVAKFIAEPRLVTKSGRPASFLVGGEQAIPVPAGLGQIGVQFEEFGTRLNFLPIVLGNGKIHLEVEPEISNLNAANGVTIEGTVVPGRDTQRVNTTVELETGQTFVIGGLIQHTVATNTRKTPVLGDLPFVGTFFSEKSDNQVEQEVVILVTPYLVDSQSCDQVAKVLPGQETRTADDFELFLEGILEAPRGPRQLCQGGHYIPAFKNSSTTDLFPCAGKGTCGAGCGAGPAANPAGPGALPGHVTGPTSPVTPAAAIAPAAEVPAQPAASEAAPAPGTEPPAAKPADAAAPAQGAPAGDSTATPAPVAPPGLLPAPTPPADGGKP